jgi:hypothetical protein
MVGNWQFVFADLVSLGFVGIHCLPLISLTLTLTIGTIGHYNEKFSHCLFSHFYVVYSHVFTNWLIQPGCLGSTGARERNFQHCPGTESTGGTSTKLTTFRYSIS